MSELTVKRITMEVKEVAAMLGVSTGTIYTMVRTEEIPHLRVRNRVLFNRAVIEAWARGELNTGINQPAGRG